MPRAKQSMDGNTAVLHPLNIHFQKPNQVEHQEFSMNCHYNQT